MRLEHAPRVLHEPVDCSYCDRGTFVLFQGDKVCPECGYLSGTGDSEVPDDPWLRWRYIRNEQWEDDKHDHRETRKVVGSYVHAYVNEDGQIET